MNTKKWLSLIMIVFFMSSCIKYYIIPKEEEEEEKNTQTWEEVFFNESELAIISFLIDLIPEKIKAGYDEKYLAWEKSWTRYELHSGDIFYALSDEYDDLVHYCKKYGKAIYPLVFNKVAQRGRYTSNLLRDLTYNRDDSFYDYLASPFKCIPTNLKWDLKQSALVYYCKGLLEVENEDILKAILETIEKENESFETKVSVNSQGILLHLHSEKAETANVKIFNLFGGLEFESNYQVSEGRQSVVIDSSNFKKGIYVLQITIGGESKSQKISI